MAEEEKSGFQRFLDSIKELWSDVTNFDFKEWISNLFEGLKELIGWSDARAEEDVQQAGEQGRRGLEETQRAADETIARVRARSGENFERRLAAFNDSYRNSQAEIEEGLLEMPARLALADFDETIRQATEAYKAGRFEGDEAGVDAYKAFVKDSIADFKDRLAEHGLDAERIALGIQKDVLGENFDPEKLGAIKNLVASEQVRGEKGVSVVIKGDLSTEDGKFIQAQQDAIAKAFADAYEKGSIPNGSPLAFADGKWTYTQGDRTVSIDPSSITIASSRVEGTAYFDGKDPSYEITRVAGLSMNGQGALAFASEEKFTVQDIDAKIAGARHGRTHVQHDAGILNDEIAALVAAGNFALGQSTSVQDNDHADVEATDIKIEDVVDGQEVSSPATVPHTADDPNLRIGGA